MKKIMFLLLMLPLLGRAQAHLGMTESEIKSEHPGLTFTSDVTTKGVRYTSVDMAYGTFFYYFDNNGISNYNIQIPYQMKDVNAQTEIYNNKYVILNDHSWKAYVNNGGLIYISLDYYVDSKLWVFSYSN